MYLEFTAYGSAETWEMREDIQESIDKVLPDYSFITDSALSSEDKDGNFIMCFSYGENDHFDEDGITFLDGDEHDEAQKNNDKICLEGYLLLFPLVGSVIIDVWLNTGHYWKPSIEDAQNELKEL